MNSRTAKRLRKLSGDATPRRYTFDSNGETILAEDKRRQYQKMKKDYYEGGK